MPEQTTRLVFELFGRDNASPQFDRFGRKVQQTETHVHGLGGAVGKLAGAFAGLEVVDKATEFLKHSVEEGRENEALMRRTANVIQTTGQVAHVSVKDVDELAASIQRKSAVDHEQVISAEDMLLTFKNIRNELGAGNDIFDRTTKAVTDLAATPFANMTSASKMLGKALNDPTKGLTALTRAGVQFDAKQKEQILGYVKQNDLLSAQKIILREVESQVGGAAKSQATAGKRAQLAWKDVEEEIGHKLIPTIDKAETKFADLVESGDLQRWGKEVSTDLKPVVEILEDTAKATVSTLKVLDGMPQGAKDALLLAAGLRVLSGVLPSVGAGGIAAEAGLLKTRAGLAGLAIQENAARIGAGAAGVALLTLGSQAGSAHPEIKQFTTVLGDAAVGFSVGGPWGAAVGGAIGLISAFGDANHHAVPDVDSLTGSLRKQNGMLTANTKQMVTNALQKDGAFKKARQLGVGLGDVTDASLGDKAAIARIRHMRDVAAAQNAALAEAQSPGSGRATAAGVKREFDVLLDSIGAQKGAVDKATQSWRDLHDAQSKSKSLNALTATEIHKVVAETKGIPKSVVTKFTQPGYSNAVANVAEIAKRYHLTPKQVTTALKTLDYSTNQIRAVLKLMKQADETVAHPKIRVTSNAAAIAAQAQRDINGVHGSSATIRLASRKADGGAITGPGGPREDKVLIAASPGEHMFDAEDVAAMGGQHAVYQFRRSLHSGGGPKGFASGGAVGRSTGNAAPGFDIGAFARMFAQLSAQEHAKALSNVRLVTDRQGNTRLMAFGG